MILLRYIGSVLRDYTVEGTPFKLLTQDGIKDYNDNFICKFEETNEIYNKPELDFSQSLAVMMPNENKDLKKANFDIYFVDTNNYINVLYLYDKDFVNNSYKCKVERLEQKVIYNSPLKYWKDYDDVKWIYFNSDVDVNALYRLNTYTKTAEYVEKIDFSFIQDFDTQTGFGIFNFNKLTKDNVEIHSFIKDSEIEVPNNFYITALAIKMAMAYKIKQGADISDLTLQYDEMINDFYNSRSNDDFGTVRMGNVY